MATALPTHYEEFALKMIGMGWDLKDVPTLWEKYLQETADLENSK